MKEIKKKFSKNGSSFLIDFSALTNPFVAAYLSRHYPNGWSVNVESQTGNDPQIIKGTVDQELELIGSELKISDVSIQIEVQNVDGANEITLNWITASLMIPGTPIPIETGEISTTNDLRFAAASELSPDEMEDLMTRLGVADLDVIKQQLALFSPGELFHFDLLMSADSRGIFQEIIFSAGGKHLKFDPLNITLMEEEIQLILRQTCPHETDIVREYGITCSGAIDFENKQEDHFIGFELQLLDDADRIMLNITNAPKSTFGLADALAVFGLLNSEKWKTITKDLPVLDNLFLERISLITNLKEPGVEGLRISAFLKINETFVEVSFHHPSDELSINYYTQSGEPIRTFLTTENTGSSYFTGNPHISRIGILYGLAQNYFQSSLTLQADWSFQLGRTPLIISQLVFQLNKNEAGFGGSATAFFTLGKIDFDLVASKEIGDPGWLFGTAAAHSSAIHFGSLLLELAALFHFTLPANIPDVVVSNIDLSFHTQTHDFHLSLQVELDGQSIGPFDKGEVLLSVDITRNESGSHDFKMDIDGAVEIAGTELQFSGKNFGQKNWSVDLTWSDEFGDKLSLIDLGSFFDNNLAKKKDVNKIQDSVHLKQVSFNYTHGYPASENEAASTTTFLIDAQVYTPDGNVVEGMLSGSNPNTTNSHWDFLIGVGFENPGKIPDIGAKIPDEITIESAWALINTSDVEEGTWPRLPESFPATIQRQTAKAGIIAIAKMDVSKHDKISGAAQFSESMSHAEIDLLIEINGDGLVFEAILEGTINIPTGKGHHLVLKNVTLTIKAPDPELSLQGEVDVMIDNHPVLMTGGFDINSSGIDTRLKINFEKGGISLFGLKDVRVDDFAVELGIDFVPPGVRFGVMCDIEFGKQKEPNHLGILLEFDGPVPNPEYLAIDIPKLDLSELLNQFAGSSAHGHAQVKDNLAEMSDVSLVWAEKSVVLPDGKTATPGFSFHGGIEIMNWGAYVALDVHPQTGISGGGEFSPIHLGPLSITGTGNGMFVKETWTGTEWKRVSNAQINSGRSKALIDLKDPQKGAEREFQLVSPGGAVLLFNSAGSPYLEMGVRLDLFNIKLGELDIKITSDELYFFFFIQIPGIARFKLECDLCKSATNPHFKIDGSFFLGLDIHFVVLGINVKIKLGIQAGMLIAMDPETGFELKINGGFNFFGHDFHAVILDLHVTPKGLENISKWIFDHIVDNVLPGFKKKIHNGSGAGDEDRYSDKKWMHATELLVQAREWASFVHRDMEQLMHQKNLNTEQIKLLTDKINDEADKIFKNNTHEVNINTTTSDEAEAMMVILEKTKTVLKDGSMDSAKKRREADILRMEKEMREIEDSKDELKNEIRKIWDNHEVKLRVKREKLRLVQEEVAGQIPDIKRIMEDQRIVTAEKELQDVIGRIEDQIKQLYGGMIAVRPKDDEEPIPLIPVTLYSMVAVEHHAFIIRNQRDAHERERTILETARAHSRAITDAAHNNQFNLIKPEL